MPEDRSYLDSVIEKVHSRAVNDDLKDDLKYDFWTSVVFVGVLVALILGFMGYGWVAMSLATVALIMFVGLKFKGLRNQDRKRSADVIKMRTERENENAE